MKKIDLAAWPRQSHFAYFEQADYPYIDLTVQMDVTALRAAIAAREYKFYPSLLWCFVTGFNAVEVFRYRIIDGDIVLYDTIDINTTVPIADERFAFYTIPLRDTLGEFLSAFAAATEKAAKQTMLMSNDRFDVAWASCNPWFSFTSMTAPTATRRMRSIPVVLIGKYYEAGGKTLLPVSLKANHALVDGIHIGKLIDYLQDCFTNPVKILT